MKLHKYLFILVLGHITLIACKNTERSDTTQKSKKPNIIYILTDQWRGSALGYAGDANVQTPNLDAFAKESVNFTNAVSVTPVCTPHRAALFTGKFPTTTGMFLNDLYLPSEELCMAEIFKAEGYNTGYLGKWHLDGHGRKNNVTPERRQGFDYWKGSECDHNYNKEHYYANNDPEIKYWDGYSPFSITKDANQYIANHAIDKNPFLLVISFATPHFPHESAPQKYKDMYREKDLKLAPNVSNDMKARALRELQGYYAHATATDEMIGSILEQIKNLNLLENTIIVFTSDHGEMMGAHGVKPFTKQLAWDESVRVPFLIRYPKIEKNKGARVNAPINTPDILPSLLGLTNIKIPKDIEGSDLSNLIRNPDSNFDRAALIMGVSPFGINSYDPAYRAIRTKQYTYERTVNGPSMLFDNIMDPHQMDNLVNKPEFKPLQDSMEAKLQVALQKIGDDFKPKEYYINKWNYTLDPQRNSIDYWSWENGKQGVVVSPKQN